MGKYTPLDLFLTLVLFKFPGVESHGQQTSVDPDFTPGSKFTGNLVLA